MSRKVLSKRYFWADGVRATAIFLIVYVHQLSLLPPLTRGDLWIWVPNLFALLGVPLFVMLSGALLLPKKEKLLPFLKKRTVAVLLPWVFWVTIYFLLEAYSMSGSYSFSELLRLFYRTFFSRFWFLPLIFGLYLLTPLLRVFVQNAGRQVLLYAVSLWFLGIVVLPTLNFFYQPSFTPNNSMFYYVLQYTGLFALGHLLLNTNLIKKSNFFWVTLFLGSVIATYLAVYLTMGGKSIEKALFFSQIFSPTVVFGVLAAFMLLHNFYQNHVPKNKTIKKVFFLTSQAALGIYLVHELAQGFLVTFLPKVPVLPFFLALPLRAVLVFGITLASVLLLRRIPLLKHFV